MEFRSPHLQLASLLEQEIRASKKVGERLESERVLARRFGVSNVTISKSLALLAQRNLVVRKSGSGTFVADGLEAATACRWTGVLLEEDLGSRCSAFFHRHLAQQCRRILKERNVLTRLYAGFSDQENPSEKPTCDDFLFDLQRGFLSGVIMLAGSDRAGSVAMAVEQGVPVVGPGPRFPYHVDVDRVGVLRRCVEHALERGRRRFALLDWSNGAHRSEWSMHPPHPLTPLRESLREILRVHGVEMNPEWVRDDLFPMLPGAGWEEFREIWTARREHPDVLLVADDHLLPDVCQALNGLRISPEDLSLYAHCTRGNISNPSFPVVLAETDPDAFALALVDVLENVLSDPASVAPRTLLPFQWREEGIFDTDREADSHPGADSAFQPKPSQK